MQEMHGFALYLRMTQSTNLLSNNTIDGVKRIKGWLTANTASLTTIKGATNITNNNQSSAQASASVTIRQTIEVVRSSKLSEREKDALELAISRLRNASEAKDEKGFAEKLNEALDMASKAAGLVPAIVKAAGELSGLFWLASLAYIVRLYLSQNLWVDPSNGSCPLKYSGLSRTVGTMPLRLRTGARRVRRPAQCRHVRPRRACLRGRWVCHPRRDRFPRYPRILFHRYTKDYTWIA